MTSTSPSPGLAADAADTARHDTVVQPLWDTPVRLLHALMALSVAGAWLTAEADGWRAVHISFGLTLAGAVAVRLLWGIVGTPPARFSHFLRGPGAVIAHLRELLAGQAGPHAGHNPAGGWAVLALLAGGLAAAGSGWLAWQSGGEFWEEGHEALANGLLVLVGVHIAAVLLTSWRARDRLVPAMLTGRKAVPRGTPPTRAMHRGLAAVLLVATLGFWAWSLGPSSPWRDAGAGEGGHHGERHHDDD
jgi:cytochrome b